MAKPEVQKDIVPLNDCNKNYRKNEAELREQMGSAERAAHRAVDLAFRGRAGAVREQKSLRGVPQQQEAPTS